jgi:hypothetical protein
MSEYDTVFSLPDIDDEPDTELGVVLMGLGPERLLAGLGVASGTGDPATAMLLVDQLRHDARPDRTFAEAVAAGRTRWQAAHPRLSAAASGAGPRSAALRRLWAAAVDVVIAADVASGRADRVFLTACWLRENEIERIARPAG